jgi:hypothetical protein
MVTGASRPHFGSPAQPWGVPASYAQERVWFASQLAQDAPVYHILDDFRLPYPLPLEAVLEALAEICQRHETLRTSFRLDDGALMQVVHPMVSLPVTYLDLTEQSQEEQDRRIREIVEELAYTPIPLDQAPLWRGRLLRRDETTWLCCSWPTTRWSTPRRR